MYRRRVGLLGWYRTRMLVNCALTCCRLYLIMRLLFYIRAYLSMRCRRRLVPLRLNWLAKCRLESRRLMSRTLEVELPLSRRGCLLIRSSTLDILLYLRFYWWLCSRLLKSLVRLVFPTLMRLSRLPRRVRLWRLLMILRFMLMFWPRSWTGELRWFRLLRVILRIIGCRHARGRCVLTARVRLQLVWRLASVIMRSRRRLMVRILTRWLVSIRRRLVMMINLARRAWLAKPLVTWVLTL